MHFKVDDVRIREIKLLSDHWYVLKAATFDWLRKDGTWQTQTRESYDPYKKAVFLEIPIADASEIFRFLGD